MDRMTVLSRIGEDGVLHVSAPVGITEANRPVQVTIEPTTEKSIGNGDYGAWLEELSGRWEGDFIRDDEGPFETRAAVVSYLLDTNTWIALVY